MDQSTLLLLGPSVTGLFGIAVASITYLFTRRLEERKVRYARLYEQQAEVIEKLYELLRELEFDFENWIEMYDNFNREETNPRQQLKESISTKLKSLDSYNRRKALYLDKDDHDNIDKVLRVMRGKWLDIGKANISTDSGSFNALDDSVETVKEWLKRLRKETLELEIYTHFRRILGTDASQKNSALQNGVRLRRIGKAVLAGLFAGFVLGILLSLWWGEILS